MSLLVSDKTKKIIFSDTDYVEIKTEIPFSSVSILTEMKEDNTKIKDLLELILVKMVSDGKDLDVTKENIGKIDVVIATKIMKEFMTLFNVEVEEVKKN